MSIKEYSFRGNNYKLSSLDRIPQDPSWFTHEDESSVRDRDWNIQSGDVVLDIGSNYGSYTLTALVAGAAHVYYLNYSIPENEILAESISLNGWIDKTTLIQEGVYSKSGWLHEFTQDFSEVSKDGYFKVTSLNDLNIKFDKIDWIKIDVEGAEVEVLNGASKLIGDFRPKILVENHQFKDPSLQQRVCDLLSTYGYKLISCHPYHGVSHALYHYGNSGAGG